MLSTVKCTTFITGKNSETGFLEDVDVVVVGVSHGPTTRVSSSLLGISGVDKLTVTIRPVLELVSIQHLQSHYIPLKNCIDVILHMSNEISGVLK